MMQKSSLSWSENGNVPGIDDQPQIARTLLPNSTWTPAVLTLFTSATSQNEWHWR